MSVVPVSLGHHYAVSAGHELAAAAAFEVLEGGGNAVDAGVAANLTLGVVYSDQVSIARRPWSVSGRSRGPLRHSGSCSRVPGTEAV